MPAETTTPNTTGTRREDRSAAKNPGSSAGSRDLILRALRLVSGMDATTTTRTSAAVSLPTARAVKAVDYLASAGSADVLRSRENNLKVILRDALDWDNPKFTRSTKAVAKAIGMLLLGSGQDGHSTYQTGVELVGYLTVIAPLLEPDRLARVAAHAAETTNAAGPIRYHLGTHSQLKMILAPYKDDRVEHLVISLWDAAHDGQWWEHTTGVRSAGRRRRNLPPEQVEVVREQLERVLGGARVPTADLLAEAIAVRELSFSQDAIAAMRRTPEPDHAGYQRFTSALRDSDDNDHRVLAAYLPWLSVTDRPESPIPQMVAVLLTACGGASDFDAGEMPERPADWGDLYPAASRQPFPFPEGVLALHGARMPGLPGADAMLMKNADQLRKNANYMGNCTFSYRARCEQGSCAIGRFTHRGVDYNFSVVSHAGRWSLGEINSRFNRGRVPQDVRASAAQLAEGIRA